MKKIFFIVLTVIIIIAAAYILLPEKPVIAQDLSIDTSDVIAGKFLTTESGWDKWWPGTKTGDRQYNFKGTKISIDKMTNSSTYLKLKKDNLTFDGEISYFADAEGSAKFKWDAVDKNNTQFFSRITNYFKTKDTEKLVGEILLSLKHFLEDERNAYGYRIYLNHAKDTVLLVSANTYPIYPSLQVIYNTVTTLQQQAGSQGAKQTNFPMLNVTQTDEHEYQVNVALPINKTITPFQKTSINNIPKGGNLLVADVRGGQNTVNNALAQMKIYMKDHRLISPAMPFQSLVTNRLAQKDTSKWITKIYYPIL
ncbi:hypothetical protein DIU31_010880 [Mucilaginibacter rubeus]|uniref:Uncharacterized protein n=1 Tax=Mucilaginibacter rubeus TaxID=2027860 RepID=A0AAE6JEB8_9SPHI|nr:hypothetical protein [Mucilaginibacter rubeus]QEM03986.1 hypothetical protein DIU31_010880 [Mucilaginibacter rubeus]QTE40629.1 hypothetical protein J3L19_16760 [Mucilaginibacter rubeus]QTE47231.1 hypothetical protein J3L21_16740 [Mucilaginibacter rubeus]QTE58624.1 hypothetical protein J3L23_08405 [Mucilaginibacter rubeus]QTE61917.1 hypothetical protein J3L22_25455 [Mucilaginibacter rubeus]